MLNAPTQTLRAALLLGAMLLALAPPIRPGERFPFTIPGLDSEPSATDVSFLNQPGPGGVRAAGGHLVDSQGRRVRLLGVNFSFGANFPEHADAEKVAAHLAKLGVNAVRHHHMDARDIWRSLPGGGRELDPEKLDRLAYLISALAGHGIYFNLNLHVSRSVTPAEGFPDADRLPRYNKYVLYLDERLQELLQDYARGLLGFRNPYTGRRLADEPSLAAVEITNENRFSLEGPGPLRSLPERYRETFRERWNLWLRGKYTTTAALKKAWGGASEPPGGSVAPGGDFRRDPGPWRLHLEDPCRARLLCGEPGPEERLAAVRVEIERTDGVVWHVELTRGGLSLEQDRIYTASFWIRAEQPREVHVDVSRDGPPWKPIGFEETLEVGPRWEHVVRSFRAGETLDGGARWIFKLGRSDADLWLAGLELRRGGEITDLPAASSLEAGTVPVPYSARGRSCAADLRAFMEEVERDFFSRLARFLEEELGVRAPVTGSQVRWAALSALAPLGAIDFIDAHAYWEHPRFPRRSWDRSDWLIPNTPMVRVPGRDALTRLAWDRLWGRPYTVSEYNHPAPNDYQVECVPLLAAVAALQDWDGIYIYSYQHGGEDWDREAIGSYFDINGNPAKLAFLPVAAMLFRRGDVRPASRRLEAPAGTDPPRELALQHRAGTVAGREAAVEELPAAAGRRFASDTGEIVWEASDPERARFLVDTPRAKLAAGFVAAARIELGELTLETGSVTRGFGCLGLVALDGRKLAESERMLLVTLAGAENTGMVWNRDRTSVADRWGGPPVLVEIVPAAVELRVEAPAGTGYEVFALDGRGLRRDKVEAAVAGGRLRFRVEPSQRTVWYKVARSVRGEG